MSEEKWKAIPGYESAYEVSNGGLVRSLSRKRQSKSGQTYQVAERVLNPSKNTQGVRKVVLSMNGERRQRAVHHLVLEAFVRPAEPGEVASHLNGDQDDCRVENLAWVQRGKLVGDLCKRGHPLVEPNLLSWEWKRGHRTCRACNAARARARGKNATEAELKKMADESFRRLMEGQASEAK